MAGGADVIYQATFFDGRWLGYADFLLRVETPERPSVWGAVSLRGRGHEARPPRQGRRGAPDLLVRRAARADPGRAPARTCTSSSAAAPARRRVLRVDDYMAYYRAAKRGSRHRSSTRTSVLLRGHRPSSDVPRAGRPLRRLPLGGASARSGAATTTTCRSSPGSASRQRNALAAREIDTRRSPRQRPVPFDPAARRHERDELERVREQARHPGRGRGARDADLRAPRAEPTASRSRPSAAWRAPAAERGRPVPRPRGRPVRVRRRRRLPVRPARHAGHLHRDLVVRSRPPRRGDAGRREGGASSS